MNKHILLGIFTFASLFIFNACADDSNEDDKLDSVITAENENKLSEAEIMEFKRSSADLLIGFTSTIEVAAVIEDMDVPYSQNYLMNVDEVGDFPKQTKKAFALGMLSVDLGYLNIYDRIGSNLKYMTAIHELADDLDIEEYFDFQTFKRLAGNGDSPDSLIFLTVKSYHSMNEGLINDNRMHLSAAMVAGAWLEGMYLSAKVSRRAKEDKLKERIADQGEMLKNLITILDFFKDKKFLVQLTKDFKNLDEQYDEIKMKTVVDDGSDAETDTLLYRPSEPVEYQVPDISPKQYDNLRAMFEKIREDYSKADFSE